MSEAARHGIGGNLPPVIAPKEDELFQHLGRQYPEIETKLKEWGDALAEFPEEIGQDQPEVAEKLQDLLGQIKKERRVWDAHEKGEKSPWNKLVKVVTNFFAKADERAKAMVDKWGDVHQAYMDAKAAETRRVQEAEAERQRKEAERLKVEAEEAAKRQAEAEAREAAARRAEEEARQRAEEEKRKAIIAEARAKAAKAEEERLEREKRDREKREREENKAHFVSLRRMMKSAEAINQVAETSPDEVKDIDIDDLDRMLRPGGAIGVIAGPLSSSQLLDDEQRTEIAAIRKRVGELREAHSARLDAKERKRRERERKKAEEEEKARAAERERLRLEEEEKLRIARASKEAEEQAAEKARAAASAAKKEATAAKREGNEAYQEQKQAERAEAALGREADRTANRADRLERKIETATEADLSRTRGDYGTVGSLVRRWKHYVVDEAALRAVCGPLGEHFTSDALAGAAYHWMRAHQAGWDGRERVEGELAGCVFAYEQETRIA